MDKRRGFWATIGAIRLLIWHLRHSKPVWIKKINDGKYKP
jgi:hypothetical protein